MKMFRISSLFSIGILTSTIGLGQITLDTTNFTLKEMVEQLEGPGVTFSNIQVDCPGVSGQDQMGLFDATNSNVPVAEGLIMTTGQVANVVGPNNQSGAGFTGTNAGNDPDTDLLSGDFTDDACVVEFDLRMAGDTLKFNFAFGSEEYPEYVNSINDVFGFFISGPGISGPYSNNSKNIALLPDGVTPVSINSINDGFNQSYYIDNGTGATGEPQFTDPTVIQYDGMTTMLTAVSKVDRCDLYHIKLVVADASDDILDSGVFLEKFTSNTATAKATFADVYESCKEGGITFFRDVNSNNDSIIVYLEYGGTAQNGIDYGLDNGSGGLIPMPDSIIIPKDQDSVHFDIPSVDDNIIEGSETIQIILLSDECPGVNSSSDTIEITLNDEIIVEATDTIICPGDTAVVYGYSPEDVTYQWNPDVTGSTEIRKFITSPVEKEEYILTVMDTFGCVGIDTAIVDVVLTDELPFRYEYDLLEEFQVMFFPDSSYSEDYSFFWVFNDGSGETSDLREPTHKFPSNGTYPVELYVIPPGDSVDCNPVVVQDIVLDDIVLPNIITPNDDKINDFYKVRGLFGYKLTIYNKWGKKVFESEDYDEDFNGEGLSEGMYYAIIEPPIREYYKGWFKLVR